MRNDMLRVMFDHVTIRATDYAASERFYDTVLATLGHPPGTRSELGAEWDDFCLSPAVGANPPTRNLHLGFGAPSRAHVDAFWRAGVEAGYASDGEPGPRPQYVADYYGAFLLDPDGNSAEAVHHGRVRRDGVIDHLWIRIADLDASRRFYDLVAPHAGFLPGDRLRDPDRVIFRRPSGGSFSMVSDGRPLTEPVHLAFAGDDAAVAAFHRETVAAGHRDNGAPGERPEYHPGYVAAFVLDPDGHNVEVVDHHGG